MSRMKKCSMRISFFEEFPSADSFSKISMIHFPTKLYVASDSYESFLQAKKMIGKAASKSDALVDDMIWWPLLRKEDGYWLSPFSNTTALRRVCSEIKKSECNVMMDMELPFRRSLIFSNLFNFSKNKRMLKQCIVSSVKRKKIYTAEYLCRPCFNTLLKFMGLSFDPAEYKSIMIKMFYSSMHSYNITKIENIFRMYASMYGSRFMVGLGVLGKGIRGDEPGLEADLLRRDINIAKRAGVREVVIFRLGGLSKTHVEAINSVIP